MKRWWSLLIAPLLLISLGCVERYEARMNATLDKLRYLKKLDDNLMPPSADGPFKELAIYVRPPKPLEAAGKGFFSTLFPTVQEGQYDLTAVYQDTTPEKGVAKSARMFVLARKKQSKAPASKKEAAPPPANRGPFDDDVLALLQATYPASGESLRKEQLKSSNYRKNAYKRLVFKTPRGSDMEVFFYKTDPYDVALLFEKPSGVGSTATNLSLESFAVGTKALRNFDRGFSDEEGFDSGGGGAGGGSPTPF